MRMIQILSADAATQQQIFDMIEVESANLGVESSVEYVSDPEAYAKVGAGTAPAVVVDGKLRHAGVIADGDVVKDWLID